MRKLSCTVAFVTLMLMSIGSFAQKGTFDVVNENEKNTKEVVEIAVHELPQAIIAVVTSNFTEHTTAQAFKVLRNNKEAYLVKYTKENVKQEVLFDVDGSIIKQNEIQL